LSVAAHVALLLSLAWHCAFLSLFAVGGGVSMLLPQIRAEFVQQFHWVDDRSFTELIAVAQTAPGPNFLLIPLLGWRMASWPGLLVALFSFLLFPVTISFAVGRLLHDRENEWIGQLRRSFQPVTGGLWVASGTAVAIATDHALVPAALTIAVLVLSLLFEVSPLWWCLGAGIAGALLA
jgi:chromate transporter